MSYQVEKHLVTFYFGYQLKLKNRNEEPLKEIKNKHSKLLLIHKS